jgi:hypothetical protein
MSKQQLQRFRNALAIALLLTSLQVAGQEFRPGGVASGWAKNSINTVIFRKNSLASFKRTQYIAFYDSTGHVSIYMRKRYTNRWQIGQAQYFGNPRDAHRSISIIVDGDGYLHCSFDQHDSRLRYARSIAPGSPELGPEIPMLNSNENRVTYPEFERLPDGNLLFLYRDGASGNGNLILNHYDTKTKTWTRLHDKLIDGEGKRNAYWQTVIDAQGTLHLSWTWRESPDVASNHDIAYARSRDGGRTWETSTGKPYTLPITAATAEYAARISQNSGLINQTSMCADSAGNPYIATYWRPNASAVPQYMIVYKDTSGWHTKQASDRTTPFLLGGAGTKRIPMSRPQVLIDGDQLILVYRDSEQGNKITIATCSHFPAGAWSLHHRGDIDYGSWEPTYDQQLWNDQHVLDLFAQRVGQGDGETLENLPAQPISILSWNPKFPNLVP